MTPVEKPPRDPRHDLTRPRGSADSPHNCSSECIALFGGRQVMHAMVGITTAGKACLPVAARLPRVLVGVVSPDWNPVIVSRIGLDGRPAKVDDGGGIRIVGIRRIILADPDRGQVRII